MHKITNICKLTQRIILIKSLNSCKHIKEKYFQNYTKDIEITAYKNSLIMNKTFNLTFVN